MDDGRLIEADPKSHAGTRTVAFPKDIVPELRDHLERFADPKPRGLVFIGPKGGRLRRSNFRKFWHRARERSAFPNSTSTICGTPGTRWRPCKEQPCGS